MPKFNFIPVYEFMSALRFQLLSIYCENSNISPNFIHGYKLLNGLIYRSQLGE